jgi:hypothetical protein
MRHDTLNKVFTLLIVTLVLFSCKKDNNEIKNYQLSGYAQKGPFMKGSKLTIAELDNSFKPTGKVYFSTITGDDGYFDIPDVQFASNYAQIWVEGQFFNEISNQFDPTSYSLYSTVDLSSGNNFNINLLSHLSQQRIVYLMHNGKSFIEPRGQAYKEVMKIFTFKLDTLTDLEQLNIIKAGEQNAMFLAGSLVILNASNYLTEFLTNISNDIKNDGILNDTVLQKDLINSANLLDSVGIRNNLNTKYFGLPNFQIPHFEKYLKQFIDSSKYKSTVKLIIPDSTEYGKNLLLLPSGSVLQPGKSYSIALSAPITNDIFPVSITIRRISSAGNWSDIPLQNLIDAGWEISYGSPPDYFSLLVWQKRDYSFNAPIIFSDHGEITLLFGKCHVDHPGCSSSERRFSW